MPAEKRNANSNEFNTIKLRDLYRQIKLLNQKYIIPIVNQIKQILGKKSHNLTWRNAENPTTNSAKIRLNWRNENETLPNLNTQNTNRNPLQNSNVNQNTINSENNLTNKNLIWLNETENTARQSQIPNSRQYFGRNVNLWQQSDSNQCGVCSLLNVFEVCGIQTNLNNIAAIRARVIRNRIKQGELKIENGLYYKEVQSSRRENRIAGWERITDNNFAENFWLSTTDVRTILRQTLDNNPNFKYGGISDNYPENLPQNIRESKMCILNINHNHWICCFQYTNSGGQKVWAKIDSLSSNLISDLGQNPNGTNKTPSDIASRYNNGSLSEIMFIKSKLNWQN